VSGSANAGALRSERLSAAGRGKAIEQLARVEEYFGSLMRHADTRDGAVESADPGLGGRLLYAGELHDEGRALATAGNVAGAATLAATADAIAQTQAIREGVVDFLVNSLDEALRILKNEIRKREPVAVCVSSNPREVEHEMRERGVQPDLLAEIRGAVRGAELRSRETHVVRPEPVAATQALLAWCVTVAPAHWMPMLDAMAMDCVCASEWATLRWLRHAPRYVSRGSRGVRVLRCSPQTARAISTRIESAMQRGTIETAVWMAMRIGDEREWRPSAPPEAR